MRHLALMIVAALLWSVPDGADAQTGVPSADRALARDILRELVEIHTTASLGNPPRAARAMARRLVAAGFPAADVRVLIGPDAKHGNLVARYRGTGTGGRPIIGFAHLDVVPARRADWSVDPFTFLEKDGYFYGRGTTDDKVGDAILVADFIRLRRARFKPRRDLIMVLTGDEETAGSCIAWLVNKHRDLIDAEFALNTDAGGGVLRDGRRVMFSVQASEKVYATYALEATDKGGHSSLPRPADNPVYRLAPVLGRLAAYQFPVKLNEVSRGTRCGGRRHARTARRRRPDCPPDGVRAHPEPALASHAGDHRSDRAAGRGAVPQCADRACDGGGRDRRVVPP